MKALFFLLSFGFTALSFASCNPDEAKTEASVSAPAASYGEAIQTDQARDLKDLIASYDQIKGKPVQMKAMVTNVCRTKGCWMSLSSTTDEEVRVKFKDYGFFVPISLIGKEVLVEGDLERKEVSAKLLAHYKEDAGASKEQIAAVQGPAYEYTFTAKGVVVKN